MSTSFEGFTENDIRKVTAAGKLSNSDDAKPKDDSQLKKAALKVPRRNGISKKQFPAEKVLTSSSSGSIPQEARLVQKGAKRATSPPTASITPTAESCDSVAKSCESLPEKKINGRSSIDFAEFQAKQKLIEEQNRKRKEMLAKALADRTKQTEEQAKRLKIIQEEFKKLDDLLSTDVSILRKQIEAASIEFMEAQKKYLKIEKEFLNAKIMLQQKHDKKEMLTEHLCHIIERNEERKAEKLSELMSKLELVDENPILVEEETKDTSPSVDLAAEILDKTDNMLKELSATLKKDGDAKELETLTKSTAV